eukprot:m.187129 g.187129  ORF g.187129 m.187129 type:complete len:71 (+) comp39361_c0_seq5:188-400(+)
MDGDFLHVAGPTEAVCNDCVAFTRGSICSDNCRNNIISLRNLTSGYLIYPDDTDTEKPSGKCSHGALVDK